jgi:hypothetical protein
MPNLTIANAPIPVSAGNDWNLLPQISGDLAAFQPLYVNSNIVSSHTKFWVPEMSGWTINYDDQGVNTATQSWIAPFYAQTLLNDTTVDTQLPMAVRQLQSWNRELYAQWATFFDSGYNESYTLGNPQPGQPIAYNLSDPLVPTSVDILPRPDLMDQVYEDVGRGLTGTTLSVLSRVPANDSQWTSGTGAVWNFGDYLSKVRKNLTVWNKNGTEYTAARQVFPRIRSQYWQVNIRFQRDPYVNRFNIRYAKVDTRPAVRMQALKNVPSAIVPTDNTGQPAFNAVYSDPANADPVKPQTGPGILDPLTTGFPIRETLIEYRITYPWVPLDKLLAAGPIGNPQQLVSGGGLGIVEPFEITPGMYLGAVNLKSFLGYSRGRVLYSGCELTEVVSPVTGKIGFKVTHEFMANPTMEWNQVRYNGTYNPNHEPNADAQNPGVTWQTGFIVRTNKVYLYQDEVTGDTVLDPIYRIKLKDTDPPEWTALYPYPYMNFNDPTFPGLLYYGFVGDNNRPTQDA